MTTIVKVKNLTQNTISIPTGIGQWVSLDSGSNVEANLSGDIQQQIDAGVLLVLATTRETVNATVSVGATLQTATVLNTTGSTSINGGSPLVLFGIQVIKALTGTLTLGGITSLSAFPSGSSGSLLSPNSSISVAALTAQLSSSSDQGNVIITWVSQ